MTAHGFGGIIIDADITQHFGEEARVEQVHHGMLGAAGVDIDWQPVSRFFSVKGRSYRNRATGSAVDTKRST